MKLPLYAGTGTPEVWIVDLASGEVESHAGPRASTQGYATRRRYGRGEDAVSETASGLALPVNEILGGQRKTGVGPE